ncbi:MAG: hypothetical protein KKB20_17625 [Proteobacteria bacterium]|nr:hypothetical protein [Pseudomonadota bacterium]
MADQQTTPETVDLTKIFENGMQRFQGELDEAALGAAPVEDDGPDDEISGPAEALAEETEEEPGSSETPPEGDEPSTPRFKTHEEAEKGYRNIQAEKTRLELENKALKSAQEAAAKAALEAEAKEKETADFLEFTKGRTKQALEEINALDPEDPDHEEKVALAWARMYADTRNFQYQPPAGAAPGTRSEEPAPAAGPKPAEGAGEPDPQAMALIKGKLAEAGLDPEDEYFWLLADRGVPTRDPQGNALTFEQSLAWAIETTKTHNQKIEQRIQDRIKAAAGKTGRSHQDQGLPLGRSGARRARPSGAAVPVKSIGDALDLVQGERRL